MTRFAKSKERGMGILGIQFLEILLVILCLILSFALAGLFIYGDYFPFGIQQGILLSAMVSAIAVVILASFKYFNFMSCSFVSALGRSISIVLSINVVLILILYFISEARLSPYYFIVAVAFQYTFLLLIKIFSSLLKQNTLQGKRALVVGKSSEKEWLLERIRRQCEYQLRFLDERTKNFTAYIDRSDYVYLLSSASLEYKRRIITYCELQGKRLYIVPEVHEIAMRDSELTRIGDIPLFTIDQFRLTEAQAMIKRVMDILIALLGTIITSPLLLVSSIFIKAEDGGPVFYRQTRSGINGREFEIWKLRSMKVNAEKTTGSVFATENDPRITKVGRFLRQTRMDEIPQFFNVISGSMSIVGPRPERPCFVQKFCSENPEYNLRLAVKPGITGLAQVMANYTTTPENKLKFDLFYIKSYSPLLDFRIMVKTAVVIFGKSHSAGFKEEKEDNCGRTEIFDIEGIPDFEPEECLPSRGRRRRYNWLKVGLTILGCGVIVLSAIFMRYNPLIERLNQELIWNETGIVSIVEAGVPMSEEASGSIVASAAFSKPVKPAVSPLGWAESWEMVVGLILRLEPSELSELEAMAEGGFSEEELARTEELLNMQRR